jgi:hypothetical protein
MYYYRTAVGTFWIRPHEEFPDRVRLGVGDSRLASFHSPAAAAETVHARQTGWAEWDGRDDLLVPADLSEWTAGEPAGE